MSVVNQTMGDEKILERFQRLFKRERLAHAYLLIGPKGSGKVETALAVARLVNCESPGGKCSDACPSCRKILSGNHPDVVLCDQGDDQSIKIQKIRDLIQRIQLHPYEAKRKVVIIKDIDLMTTESANAFLKTLEEPTASSLLLLTTANPERILPTVRSRCHAVHFFGFSRHELSRRLQRESGLSGKQADVIAGFSEGCYGKSERLQEEGFISRRNAVMKKFLFDGVDEAFLKEILADKETIKEALDILLFCFKDMMLLKAGAQQEHITNSDRVKELTTCTARYSLDQLRDVMAEIVNTKKLMDANLNIKVPLMLLKEKIWISS